MEHRAWGKIQRSEVRGQTTESKNKARLVSTGGYQDFRLRIGDWQNRLNWPNRLTDIGSGEKLVVFRIAFC